MGPLLQSSASRRWHSRRVTAAARSLHTDTAVLTATVPTAAGEYVPVHCLNAHCHATALSRGSAPHAGRNQEPVRMYSSNSDLYNTIQSQSQSQSQSQFILFLKKDERYTQYNYIYVNNTH